MPRRSTTDWTSCPTEHNSPSADLCKVVSSQLKPPQREREMKRFEGKVAIVTGGNSGIDLAEARRLHGEGARVAITSPDKAKLDEAEASIGENVVTVVIDLAKVTRIDRPSICSLRASPRTTCFSSTLASAGSRHAKSACFTIQKAIPVLNDDARASRCEEAGCRRVVRIGEPLPAPRRTCEPLQESEPAICRAYVEESNQRGRQPIFTVLRGTHS